MFAHPVTKRTVVRGVLIVAAATAFIIAVQHHLARPDLRGFDSQQMGSLESGMWRSYYEGRWGLLGWQTLTVAHDQCGFSWWDSLRMGAHAARSALYFRKNTDDPRCLPELEAYYTIIRRGTAGTFDIPTAARLELEWWKERRRNVPPQDYARTIARLAALVYGLTEESMLPASRLRAEAMAFRDARRDAKMTDADWQEVSRQLEAAYAAQREALAGP